MMDKETVEYWKKSRAQIRAELRDAGFDPKQLVSRVKELVNAKVHHPEVPEVRAELRNAGFDPKQLVSREKELVNAKVHHPDAPRGRHHQRVISGKKVA
jgi:hypothetical protein